jgi:hypothetical protein
MKIRLRQAVVYDGITYPANHVLETKGTGISEECLIQREWGEQVSDDTPESELAEPEPVAVVVEDEPSPNERPTAEQPVQAAPVAPVVAADPAPEQQPKPKRKSK